MLVGGMHRAVLLLFAALISWSLYPVRLEAATPVPVPVPVPLATDLLAYTQGYNVFSSDFRGLNRHALTNRGSAAGIRYPVYSWSPDGKYLLLVRSEPGKRSLLLLNPNGFLLRILATVPVMGGFPPAWAQDADRVVFVAAVRRGASHWRATVQTINVSGQIGRGWTYDTTGGCAGGSIDPATRLYAQQTGPNGIAPTIQWNVERHLAVYSYTCNGTGLAAVNTRTGVSQVLGRNWAEGALSPSGRLAVVQMETNGIHRLVLTEPRVGMALRPVVNGELPLWSGDGRFLYFVQRQRGMDLRMRDGSGYGYRSATFTSSIFRANADGTYLLRLVQQDAYGLGPLRLTPDGLALIFSRVDNLWHLWNHRLPDNRYTPAILRQYGPHVAIQRFDSGETAATIVQNAGQPAVQPTVRSALLP